MSLELRRKCGADDPIRTDDLLITSELLYQLSYVGLGHLAGAGAEGSRAVAGMPCPTRARRKSAAALSGSPGLASVDWPTGRYRITMVGRPLTGRRSGAIQGLCGAAGIALALRRGSGGREGGDRCRFFRSSIC